MIPELEPHCGSWALIRDGKILGETFDRATAEQCARYGYEVITMAAWLARLNREGAKR